MARKLPRFLTVQEVNEMFKAAKGNERDHLLLKCLFFLGLRNNELRRLDIEDIDLINKNVKIVQGKGKKDRYVTIPENLVEDIKKYIGNRVKGPLFLGRDQKGMLSDRHLRRIVKKYAIAAGIRKPDEVHVHTLRHSYATHLQNQGVPLNIIKETLGHERIETTTIYLHLGVEGRRKFIEEAFKGIKWE